MSGKIVTRVYNTVHHSSLSCPSCMLQRLAFLKKTPLYKPLLRLGVSNEEINATVKKEFPGRKIVINSSEDEKKPYKKDAISFMLNADVVGFDTETKPEFILGKTNTNKIALIQIATDDMAIIWRIHKNSSGNMPVMLMQILSNHNILKVGHGVQYEVEELYRQYNIELRNVTDTQLVAKVLGSPRLALTALTAMFCGWTITKVQQRSNWERNTLTQEQISYAATDAWAALQTYHQMKRFIDTLHLDLPSPIGSSLKYVLKKEQEYDRKLCKKMDKIFLDKLKQSNFKNRRELPDYLRFSKSELSTQLRNKKASEIYISRIKERKTTSGSQTKIPLPPFRTLCKKSATDLDILDGLLWNIKDFDQDVWVWIAEKSNNQELV